MSPIWLPVPDEHRWTRVVFWVLLGTGSLLWFAALDGDLGAFNPGVSTIDMGLLFGPAIVMPLAAGRTIGPTSSASWPLTSTDLVRFGAVLWVVQLVALVRGGRELSPLLPLAYLAVMLGLVAAVIQSQGGFRVAERWRRIRELHPEDTAILAHLYLVVAAVWFLLHHLGQRPLDLSPDIVELTAVHFHYAGFAALIIVRDVRAVTLAGAPRTSAAALALVAVAPPVIAIGFAAVRPLQVIGAVLLTAGLWTSSWLTLRHVVPTTTGLVRSLLVVSSLSVLVPMALAVNWALANLIDIPALSIPDMADIHGTTNALGFTIPALLAWGAISRRPGP